MAYKVEITCLPNLSLGKADVEFVVTSEVKGEGVLGTLRISKGAIVWYPKKTTHGHKASWQKFSDLAKKFPDTESR